MYLYTCSSLFRLLSSFIGFDFYYLSFLILKTVPLYVCCHRKKDTSKMAILTCACPFLRTLWGQVKIVHQGWVLQQEFCPATSQWCVGRVKPMGLQKPWKGSIMNGTVRKISLFPLVCRLIQKVVEHVRKHLLGYKTRQRRLQVFAVWLLKMPLCSVVFWKHLRWVSSLRPQLTITTVRETKLMPLGGRLVTAVKNMVVITLLSQKSIRWRETPPGWCLKQSLQSKVRKCS